jgi:hypothetical protein
MRDVHGGEERREEVVDISESERFLLRTIVVAFGWEGEAIERVCSAEEKNDEDGKGLKPDDAKMFTTSMEEVGMRRDHFSAPPWLRDKSNPIWHFSLSTSSLKLRKLIGADGKCTSWIFGCIPCFTDHVRPYFGF